MLPNVPYLIELLLPIFSDPVLRPAIQDAASGLFISAFSFGAFISPIISGNLYDQFGNYF